MKKLLPLILITFLFLFLFTNQIRSHSIVITLEPKSMLGLVTHKEFEHLLNAGEYYPILRVVAK